jgi:hypothetical protein
MSDKRVFTLSNVLIVVAALVGVVVLLRLVLAKSRTVVQQAQTNPLISLIDAAPSLVNATANFLSSVWTREDGNPSGIDPDFVDSLPMDHRR